jgi:hypothetical protein
VALRDQIAAAVAERNMDLRRLSDAERKRLAPLRRSCSRNHLQRNESHEFRHPQGHPR